MKKKFKLTTKGENYLFIAYYNAMLWIIVFTRYTWIGTWAFMATLFTLLSMIYFRLGSLKK